MPRLLRRRCRHLLPAAPSPPPTRRGTCHDNHEHPQLRCPLGAALADLPCRSSSNGNVWGFTSWTHNYFFGWADAANQYVAANYGINVSDFRHSEWGKVHCAVQPFVAHDMQRVGRAWWRQENTRGGVGDESQAWYCWPCPTANGAPLLLTASAAPLQLSTSPLQASKQPVVGWGMPSTTASVNFSARPGLPGITTTPSPSTFTSWWATLGMLGTLGCSTPHGLA